MITIGLMDEFKEKVLASSENWDAANKASMNDFLKAASELNVQPGSDRYRVSSMIPQKDMRLNGRAGLENLVNQAFGYLGWSLAMKCSGNARKRANIEPCIQAVVNELCPVEH